MNRDSESRDMNSEWENRVLCSDESCIGTIGPDGRCRECGLQFQGTPPKAPLQGQVDEAAATDPEQADADIESRVQASSARPVDEGPAEQMRATAGDDEWERRTLCSDESCIGVIGPDGRCRECGKSINPPSEN